MAAPGVNIGQMGYFEALARVISLVRSPRVRLRPA
jgi:hypothetical protein